ncbi:MAG TPA: class I SAM-dependent methyltransferase [Magnetospirillum sp.]|nr:class I SAM-dependent methyltransferase [Magnetospirillum sp.]
MDEGADITIRVRPPDWRATHDWRLYYDLTWTARAEIVERIVAEGETSLSRVLGRFKRFNDTHFTSVRMENGMLGCDVLFSAIEGGRVDPFEQLRDVSCVIRGEAVAMPSYITFDLCRMLVDFAHGMDVVVELGAGYGANLFGMHLAGAPAGLRYLAMEPTAAGRALTRRLAEMAPDMSIEVLDCDLSMPDFSPLAGASCTLLFTAWSVMYVPSFPKSFFEELAKVPGEVTCMFFEPLGFQISATDGMSLVQAEAFFSSEEVHRSPHNRDFHSVAMAAAAEGLVDLELVSKHLFLGQGKDPFQLMSLWVFRKPAIK